MNQNIEKTEFDFLVNSYNEEITKDLGRFSKFKDTAHIYKTKTLKKLTQKNPIHGILDFGCGIGLNIPYLKSQFPHCQLYGCDVSSESIDVAKKTFNNCIFSTIKHPNELEFYKGKIDAVFISTVLHHIPTNEHQQWLYSLYNILNLNGILVVFEHNMRNPWTNRVVKKSKIDIDATMLSPKYCKKLVSNLNIKTIEHNKETFFINTTYLQYTYFFPWRNKITETIERLFAWLPLGAQYCVYTKKHNTNENN
ncbi:MAG: class I SAM-dependent methyltransferase [Marinilabiliaceae bacterium]|nr:class I SAM-dependent methyltransferase [Marinilabiliaceae bacterium]